MDLADNGNGNDPFTSFLPCRHLPDVGLRVFPSSQLLFILRNMSSLSTPVRLSPSVKFVVSPSRESWPPQVILLVRSRVDYPQWPSSVCHVYHVCHVCQIGGMGSWLSPVVRRMGCSQLHDGKGGRAGISDECARITYRCPNWQLFLSIEAGRPEVD